MLFWSISIRSRRGGTENASLTETIEKLQNEKGNSNISNVDVSRLEKAILAVQETSDKIKESAREEARVIVEEAKNNASSIVHEALIKAEKTEQDRMLLEKNMKIYKERIRSLVESQIHIVDDLDKIEI